MKQPKNQFMLSKPKKQMKNEFQIVLYVLSDMKAIVRKFGQFEKWMLTMFRLGVKVEPLI
jgi:hypothetical protein